MTCVNKDVRSASTCLFNDARHKSKYVYINRRDNDARREVNVSLLQLKKYGK
jgi:hypothetical protein